MEKSLERGEDKIQKICDALRKQTLEPAKAEAAKIIEDAKAKAEQIVKEAHSQAAKYLDEARVEIEKERNVFHSSLQQAGKQTLEELRQAIEEKLFSDELRKIVNEKGGDPKVIARLIEAIVKAVEKDGISAELSAVIPQTVSSKEVNALLGEEILKKLKDKGVVLGQFAAGAEVKLLDRKMTIDITDKALIELLTSYVRKDFRKLLFKT